MSRRGRAPVAKPKSTGKTIKRILKYLSPYKLRLFFVAFAIILSSGASIAGTYFLKPLINDFIVPLIGQQNPSLSGFIRLLSIMGGVYLIGVFATYAYQRIMVAISAGILAKIRDDMFVHMQKLPIKYFDTHTHGELMSRFTNDNDTLREMLSQSLPAFFNSLLSVSGVFVMMIILSPPLTILVVLMLFIIVFAIKNIGSRSGKYFKEQQKEIGRANGYIEEMIEGQKVVKVFSREKNVVEDFKVINDDLCKAAANANTYANILMPIMGNLSHMHYAITAAAGGVLAIYGFLDIGTIASFLQYTRSFSHPISHSSQQFNAVLNALAGAERIFDMMDATPEENEGKITLVKAEIIDGKIVETHKNTGIWAWKKPTENGYSYTQVKGDVRFNNVTFGYDEDKIVLKNLSLYAKPGQKIAFVGSTGAGKTTITNLINRFYDIKEGEILYDGINIKDIKKEDLRSSLAMVLQDTHLFTGTVRENIRYGNLNATDKEVEDAAKLANAHSFIMHLPQGYDTLIVSDGSNLSQGQRQLLSIARAAVANPPVLILDEATSSIDTRTELLIGRGMDKLMHGRTVFVIAHRLSTVRDSDAIMVLEHGEIIERGDHDNLIEQGGKYYQLYTGMFTLE